MMTRAAEGMWETRRPVVAAVVALTAALALMLTLPSVASAAPANDNFADAETISGETAAVVGNNIGATTETGEADTTDASTRSVWYRWTAPHSGQATLVTCTSDFNTVLSVRTGTSLGNLEEISSNDHGGCTGEGSNFNGSRLSFDATKDTVYYIRVASSGTFTGNMGNFTLGLLLTDNIGPETTITDGPTGLTNDNAPTFSFSGSDNKSDSANLLFSYRVDDGVWSDYSAATTVTLSRVSDGPHTFYVRAKDEALNEGSPAERSFSVETSAPSVLTTSPTAGQTNVPRLDDITATFSEPMKRSTISSTTINMMLGTKAVPVGVSLSDDGKTATINPYPTDSLRALASNRTYKVTITTGAQDLSGKALDQNRRLAGDQPKIWSFTTGST